ncbi:hypothetical protein J4526_07475 [Desulfurococcaceae archaeon MEX13E-LK6-19]|nr:hypothetical protein J4526_07475 [Desulfurococcaceae archaeon MEX13E-LK6-19]
MFDRIKKRNKINQSRQSIKTMIKVYTSIDFLAKVFTQTVKDCLKCTSTDHNNSMGNNNELHSCESGFAAKYDIYEKDNTLIYKLHEKVYEIKAKPKSKYSIQIPARAGEVFGHTHPWLEAKPSGTDSNTFREIAEKLLEANTLALTKPYLYSIASARITSNERQSLTIHFEIMFYVPILNYDYQVTEINNIVLANSTKLLNNNDISLYIVSEDPYTNTLYVHTVYNKEEASKLPASIIKEGMLGISGNVVNNRELSPLTQWFVGLYASRTGLNNVYVINIKERKAWRVSILSKINVDVVAVNSIHFSWISEDKLNSKAQQREGNGNAYG